MFIRHKDKIINLKYCSLIDKSSIELTYPNNKPYPSKTLCYLIKLHFFDLTDGEHFSLYDLAFESEDERDVKFEEIWKFLYNKSRNSKND